MPRIVRTTPLMLVALARRVPMARLAPLLGMSDVGLAKVYRRDWVDRASRGHWARRAYGKDVPPLRLRTPRSTWREVIEFGSGAPDRVDGRRDDALIALLRRDADAPSVEVPTDLRNAHAVVRRGASAADRRPVLGGENLPGTAADAVISDPRSQDARARRFLSGLLDALKARRVRIVVDRRRIRPPPEVVILGVRFRLLVRFQRVASRGDAFLDDREAGRSRERELVLQAKVAGAASGPCWGGPRRLRVENRIEEIVAALVALAVEERERTDVARDERASVRPTPYSP